MIWKEGKKQILWIKFCEMWIVYSKSKSSNSIENQSVNSWNKHAYCHNNAIIKVCFMLISFDVILAIFGEKLVFDAFVSIRNKNQRIEMNLNE